MEKRKHILLLTTGGTIASVPGGDGLQPADAGVFGREMEQLRTYYDITVRELICLDSSNIRPAEWQLIAEGMSRKDAVKQTAKELNLPKNVVYDASLTSE